MDSALQVAAALVQYATFCVPGCAGAANAAVPQLPNPESTADIMSATQHHAGRLLQVASNEQVRHYIHYATLRAIVYTMVLLAFSACTIHTAFVALRAEACSVHGPDIKALFTASLHVPQRLNMSDT